MNTGKAGNVDEEVILQCLYEKTYTCPVCDNIFKNKTVRLGRVKLVSTAIDLKPTYTPLNSLFYDVVSCQLCGYTALDSSFDKIGLKQSVIVRQALAKKFVARSYPQIYDANIAIIRYKLALICADLKKSKKSEFAYIALRLSWLYNEINNVKKEKEYSLHAYELFKEAYTTENFPLYAVDEMTSAYLIGVLAYKLEDMEEALKWMGNVIISRSTPPRLKEKAMDLKELIKAKKIDKL